MTTYKLTGHTVATLTPQMLTHRDYYVQLNTNEFLKIVKAWPDGACLVAYVFRGTPTTRILQANSRRETYTKQAFSGFVHQPKNVQDENPAQ